MHIVIYGKDSCPYCQKAKKLSEGLQQGLKEEVIVEYHNTIEEGLDRFKLTKIMGFEVTTVPQILVDKKPIPEGYTGFNRYIQNELAKGNLNLK